MRLAYFEIMDRQVLLTTYLLFVLFVVLLMAGCATSTIGLADDLAVHGEWDKAIAAYRDAIKNDPFNPELQDKLNIAKVEAASTHYLIGPHELKNKQFTNAYLNSEWPSDSIPRRQSITLQRPIFFGEGSKRSAARREKLRNLGRQEDALLAYESAVELAPSLTETLTKYTELPVLRSVPL